MLIHNEKENKNDKKQDYSGTVFSLRQNGSLWCRLRAIHTEKYVLFKRTGRITYHNVAFKLLGFHCDL